MRFALFRIMTRLLLTVALLFPATAGAQPPADADPALGPWFRSLLVPGTSVSCCSVTDCRATEYRIEADHYEALIGGSWQVVPPDKILQRTDNPTGHAVVCWTPETLAEVAIPALALQFTPLGDGRAVHPGLPME